MPVAFGKGIIPCPGTTENGTGCQRIRTSSYPYAPEHTARVVDDKDEVIAVRIHRRRCHKEYQADRSYHKRQHGHCLSMKS